jgi:hypothetical protein
MVKVSDFYYPVTLDNPNPAPPLCDICKTPDLPRNFHYFYHCEPCMHDICPVCSVSASPLGVDTDSIKKKVRLQTPVTPVIARLKLLQMLNKSIESTLPFIDLSVSSKSGTVACLLSKCKALIVTSIKMAIWDKSVEDSQTFDDSPFELHLSRPRATKHAKICKPDDEALFSCFSQAFRQMHNMPASLLRRNSQLYITNFVGEKAVDAMDAYRGSFEIFCRELQSQVLSLLVPTPNARYNIGNNRDHWILNPGATSLLQREMLVFLGKLFGIAIRGKTHLSLKLPSIVWKFLVGETPSRIDIENVDRFQVTSLDHMRNIDREGIDSSIFNYVFFENFTTVSLDNRVVDLVPRGSDIPVLFENRLEYCDLSVAYRLREVNEQASSLLEGLTSIIPASLLTFTTWEQLERLVCGMLYVTYILV